MAATNINRVILTGNLTRDPELRTTGGGLNICSLRLAVNTRRKDGQTGNWIDEPNYFDVTVFGAQGENCHRFLAKGRPVALDGRLKWREWTDNNTQQKRQAVEIIADSVQFLGGGGENGGGGQGGGYGGGQSFAPQSDVPSDTSDFQPAGAPAGAANGHSSPADDDIPF